MSCSQFVRRAVDEAFGEGYWLELVHHDLGSVALDGGAKTMWLRLAQTDHPAQADLRFFGGDERDDWHVMMFVDSRMVIGAVPGDAVRELDAGHFSCMQDRGVRRMPLPG